MPSGHPAEPPVSGEAPAPGRMSRFARVFGALGGSRGAARPDARETSTSGRDRLDDPAAAGNSTFREYSPLDNANVRGGAAPRRGIRPAPAAARETSGPRRGSRPAYAAEERPTPDRYGPAGSAAREDTPPSRSESVAPREGAAPERDDRRAFTDTPRNPARTAGYPAPGGDHPASDSDSDYAAFRGGDRAARERRRPGAESGEPGWRPDMQAGHSGTSGGDPERAGHRQNAASGESRWRAGRPGPGDPPPTKEYRHADFDPEHDTDGRRVPRKLTVTRVAAMRGKELTGKGIATFRRAAEADGADKSGLTALTYATMANFALDAAIAVALANTLFFASATAESKSKVALYLLITIAPFAIIAPLIGPALDRLQTGRRLALAASFAARAVVAVVLIFSMDSWVLYPLALCMMVLSKSFAVLKSAVTPRVLPPDIDLVRTNSRLTVFGLVGGTLGAGGIAGATAALTGSTGALILATGIAVGGAYLSWKIPRWVEITEGEVPATLGYHGHDPQTEILEPGRESPVPPRKRRQPLGRAVVTGLWGNGSIRVLTGFLTFYIAFVAKATEHRPVQQAAMLGLVGAAAAVGNFAGNATGARLRLGRPSLIVVNCTLACTVAAAAALLLDNLLGAALAALVAAAASALAKVSLDASIQDDLPPESIASGFGRSETVLQLSWVIGGAGGVLLPTDYWKGFAVVSAVLAVGLVQTVLSSRGHSLLPGLGGRRPLHAEQEIPHHDPQRGDAAR